VARVGLGFRGYVGILVKEGSLAHLSASHSRLLRSLLRAVRPYHSLRQRERPTGQASNQLSEASKAFPTVLLHVSPCAMSVKLKSRLPSRRVTAATFHIALALQRVIPQVGRCFRSVRGNLSTVCKLGRVQPVLLIVRDMKS
jgi:hypothetical protein